MEFRLFQEKGKTDMNQGTVWLLSLAVLLILAATLLTFPLRQEHKPLTVGFIYDNDETTPYSYNFYLAQKALQSRYPDRVKTVMYSNILEKNIRESVEKLVEKDCDIIFTNSYGELPTLARRYPGITFCQVSGMEANRRDTPKNYHTFKGEIYQGRYVAGVAAGLKLEEMIQQGRLRPEEALVGYVGAYPYPEVISGFTAFLLGVRSVVPQATMRVKYANIWSNYIMERACAEELLDEGCVILSHHTDTTGVALACEDCYAREVYCVGYNADLTKVAPNTVLIGTRINWTPYVIGAVEAMLEGRDIEEAVDGTAHPGNDMSGGFDKGWVLMTPANDQLLPEGAQARLEETIKALSQGAVTVFQGDYEGVNPEKPEDTIDLREGYQENRDSSVPSFHYILRDVVRVED